MEGGPLYRLARALGLPQGRAGFVWLGCTIAVLTWVPLFLLAAAGDVLTDGPDIPFLQSLGTHARLLLVIPLFFFAEAVFDVRVRQAIRAMVNSQVIATPELPLFATILRRAIRWREAGVIEAALFVITAIFLLQGIRVDLPGDLSTWRRTPGGDRTLAGWWYGLVSLPVFQFLLWRWCVHLLLWFQVLWRVRRLDLRLLPTHPDLSGGLGFLGVAHLSLAPLNFALSSFFVASEAEGLLHGAAEIRGVVLPLALTILGSTFVLVAPLLVFTARLVRTKQLGLLEYGRLAAAYTRAFDEKWVHAAARPQEPLLGSADVQSLADLANSFDVIQNMRFVPMARHQMLFLLAAGALPAVPLIFFVIPLDELIIRSAKMLFPL
jgi:hypothetical protein